VKESVLPDAGMGVLYCTNVDTAVDSESSHLRKVFVPYVAEAPITSDSVLETLNGTEYA
jgi:hypothetical protein